MGECRHLWLFALLSILYFFECSFENKYQIICFFQILCVNLHHQKKFNPINLI